MASVGTQESLAPQEEVGEEAVSAHPGALSPVSLIVPAWKSTFRLVQRGFPLYHKPELSLTPNPGGADL